MGVYSYARRRFGWSGLPRCWLPPEPILAAGPARATCRGITLEVLLHPAGSVQNALRMVLVSHGSAEQREDPVAGGLYDISVVAMDRLDRQFEGGINDRARFYRVEILLQLGRALDVGEQRAYRFALAVN